jgi:hypothetical protein
MNMKRITCIRLKYLFATPVCCCLLGSGLFLSSCDNVNAPLDANTRQKIDSSVVAQNKLILKEVDSLCKVQHTTVLPQLVDSIKKVRVKEIEKQLESIPK